MLIINASDIKVGDQYKSGSTIQEVKEIVKTSEKTIEIRTKRVAPDYYDGNFFQRLNLSKPLIKIN